MNEFWADRPTFVSGATGLVGAWLVKRLVAVGAHVICLVRDWVPESELFRTNLKDSVTVVRGCVTDQTLLERILGEHEIDTVIHLAAQTIVGVANRNPVSTFDTNIAGTWCLLEACRRSPLVKQVVAASSDKAYGVHQKLPYNETAALQGCHPYDVSKSCADLICHTYAKSYGLPVAITRCGNFYGGGDLNWNRIIPGTIRSVIRGRPPVIRSDGTFIRDYFYVEDGAAAYLHLAEKLATDPAIAGEAFNFSNELQMSVRQVVDAVLAEMRSDLVPEVLNQATNEIPHQYLTAAKARRLLAWEPLFSFQEGITRTVAWYRDFLESRE